MAHVDPFPLNQVEDPELLECIQLMRERGTPRPEAFALFANNPDAAKGFFHYWRSIFHEGLVDHKIKELIRIKTAEIIGCTHWALTRSAQDGQITKQELAAANQAESLDGPTRAALTFAQQLTIDHHEVTKEHYDDLKRHFTPAQIVELGLFCAIQIGGVRFLQSVDVSREDLEAAERRAQTKTVP